MSVFTSLSKTQPTAYSKISSTKESYINHTQTIHKPVNCSVNRLTVFYMIQIESYF